MPQPSSGSPSITPRLASLLLAAMLAMIAVPAALTLRTVRIPALPVTPGNNPTPYGYTWSLLLFIVPILVIGTWFLPREGVKVPQRAFWRTIGILAPLGCALDFFFAHRFFLFKNPGATLGIPAPALGAPVPIEEYVFYLTGFITILLLYVWLDEYWLAAYNVPDYSGESRRIQRLLQFHPTSLVLGLLLIGGGILYKKMFSPVHDGWPAYFIVLVAGALIPAAGLYPSARPFINWRALSLTIFFILLISLIWEATLAVPYGWWDYQHPQMLGLFVGAWHDLPIEAVCVWIAVTYATAIVFEVIKLWQASGRGLREAFLGKKKV